MGYWNGLKNKIWLQLFHLFATTSITLLLPLSYLVLAKLTSARYLLSIAPESSSSFLISFLFYTNPNILSLLVSTASLNAMVYVSTDQINAGQMAMILNPRVRDAWLFLGALQVCMGFGVEGGREAGLKGPVFEGGKSVLSKAVMAVGTYETMLCWCRTVVRPVVDVGMAGVQEGNRWQWAEKAAIGGSFGGLWWWKLKNEVETLVAVVEVKRDLRVRLGLGDVLGWWLYLLTLGVGIARIAKGMTSLGMLVFERREAIDEDGEFYEDEDKV